MFFTSLRRAQKCLRITGPQIHLCCIQYSNREIFMSPAHILQTERWHVRAAPLFTHCYPTANESFENVYELEFLNPTVPERFPNYE